MKNKYIQGDLVTWNSWEGNEHVVEIIGTTTYHCCVKYSPGGFLRVENDIRMNSVKPIPLTMEILEYNGFTVGNYNEWNNPQCSFLHFVIDSLDKNKWVVYARRTEDEVQLASIKYVHELQHLLFGLGININIEINESL